MDDGVSHGGDGSGLIRAALTGVGLVLLLLATVAWSVGLLPAFRP